MLVKIVIALAVVVVVFVVVATRPSEFRVARTTTIAAPAPAVFAQVNDFHNWEAWSPYVRRDPAMKKTYEGAAAGTGAVYTWAGTAEFTFKPEGDRTAVTWSLTGQNNFMAKAVHLFMDMDTMVAEAASTRQASPARR